jgi:small subunit ribosomal protein S16
MSVKIRLQRHGKKGKPFYWIVAADARAKRDGKFLEKLGTYNPNTNPATIELDVDGSVKWLQNGAQPTDTARGLLSYKGALLKHHLAGGVRKGAFSEEEAEKKFQAWLDEKAGLVTAKVDGLAKATADAKAKALEAEKEVNAKRKAAVLEAEEALKAEAAAAEAEANAVVEEAGETTEEVVAEATETIVEEASEEVAPEESKEESAE